jgi:hypothetical protein
MDSDPLRHAYQRLLEAADTVAETGGGAEPPPGEWDSRQLLAHLVSVDAGILAAAWSVVAGERAAVDNRSSLDPANLARIARRLGGDAQLRRRIRLQGEVLCDLAEQLTEEELDQAVPTLLHSGRAVLVDGPLVLRDLISGLAEDHIPRHTQQLLALLPQDTLLPHPA